MNIMGRTLPELLRMQDGRVATAENWPARRAELKAIMQENEYGFLPPPPLRSAFYEVEADELFCAGKARRVSMRAVFTLAEGGAFSFPFELVLPRAQTKLPVFLHINFRPFVPDKYMPSEEILDAGYACVSFCYTDVASDDGDFDGLLSRALGLKARRQTEDTAPGKIMLWAWAAMRLMDFIETQPSLDAARVAVVGHSRLGKTALVAGAMDERFFCTISNDSGCGGAAIERGKQGETWARITEVLPYWFCPRFVTYAARPQDAPFDQHFLLSLVAPRYLYAASAAEDDWADPASEFIGMQSVGCVYRLLGKEGLIAPETLPVPGQDFHAGTVGYHMRPGLHYFSRLDWQKYIAFLDAKIGRSGVAER